tara:strand:+ start:1244 stop:1672 length:429 start_codon:yes stop_codon:yes gene_type:complete
MGNSNRKYQIEPRSVTLTKMNDPRYLQYNYMDDDSYDADRERIRIQLIDNTLVDTIRDGVNIVLQVDEDGTDDDELTKQLYDLLKNTKEDLIRLDYEDDYELHELLIQLSQTIRIIAQSDNQNLDNFIKNFNSMDQILDFLP